jgi:antitoxin component of RelBE/YafQ-DinJ toxin-antitoxin module
MAAAPKNRRGGRKPRVPGQPAKTLTVRMVAPERARLRALADDMGMTESDAVRSLVKREADERGIPEE